MTLRNALLFANAALLGPTLYLAVVVIGPVLVG